MNINHIFDSEKVRKMQNLGNIVSARSPLCYEQNQCAGEWTAPLSAVKLRSICGLLEREQRTRGFFPCVSHYKLSVYFNQWHVRPNTVNLEITNDNRPSTKPLGINMKQVCTPCLKNVLFNSG